VHVTTPKDIQARKLSADKLPVENHSFRMRHNSKSPKIF
jgi:hypothetical protein